MLRRITENDCGQGQGATCVFALQVNSPTPTHPEKIYPGKVLRILPSPERHGAAPCVVTPGAKDRAYGL